MRGRGLTYMDAARLMGGGGNAVVRALDTLLGGVLLAATAGGSELAISLFDAKSELTRLSEKLVATLGQRHERLGRLERSERMAAAHTVVAVAAFFEAVRDADLAFRDQVVRFGRREQTAIVSDRHASGNRLGEVAEALLGSTLPPLTPTIALRDIEEELASYYAGLGRRLHGYVAGLAVWDSMSPSEREVAESRLIHEIPVDAARRWCAAFRRLAVEFPELSFYIDRADHEATRNQLREVRAGLSALHTSLIGARADLAEGTRAGLVRRYRAVLDRPILDADDVPPSVVLPTLQDGYIDPDYRVADVGARDRFHLEEFWTGLPTHDDLAAFLVAYLSSTAATERPLLILGQPGAGKSVLTKLMAGKLPGPDFLVIHVVLRQAPADTDVQTQIEDAIRAATGERLGWPALSRTAEGALRVILLDGFDELLQATGVSQSSYLREVAAFQEREADAGRPVAVAVTSRIAVADRAQLPGAGMVALRLEPFHTEQTTRWLELWSRCNAASLAERGLVPLPPAVAQAQPALAEQPLLLLMLALYDADSNRLQQAGQRLNTADLYENLLELFARREIVKSRPNLDEPATSAAVRAELHRLSIAAIAMFHRGRQWVRQSELDSDLSALLPQQVALVTGFHAPVTPAAATIGRFFFIHRSRSRRGQEELTAVEFLHATFGEYLVARLVLNELKTLLAVTELELAGPHASALNPDLLLDLLAFSPLSMRDTVLATLRVRLDELTPQRRAALRDLLKGFYRAVISGTAGSGGRNYQPTSSSPASRQAHQSLNLLILIMLTGAINVRELFGIGGDPIAAWRRTALLWYGQCAEEGWQSFIRILQISRTGNIRNRDLRICVVEPGWKPEAIDPLWSVEFEYDDRFLESAPPFGWGHDDHKYLQLTGAVVQDRVLDQLLHAVDALPVGDYGLVTSFASTRRAGEATSAAHALTDLWLASAEHNEDRLIEAYDHCLEVGRWAFGPGNWRDREPFVTLVLRQAAADQVRLPQALLNRMTTWYADLVERGELLHSSEGPLDTWARRVMPELNQEHDAPGDRVARE